jgi:hypothetical protein
MHHFSTDMLRVTIIVAASCISWNGFQLDKLFKVEILEERAQRKGSRPIARQFGADACSLDTQCMHYRTHSFIYSPFGGPVHFFGFVILNTVGRTSWKGDRPVHNCATYTQNKRTQISMPRVGFEFTTPVFERVKTVQALDRAASVIGNLRAQHRCTQLSITCTFPIIHDSVCLYLRWPTVTAYGTNSGPCLTWPLRYAISRHSTKMRHRYGRFGRTYRIHILSASQNKLRTKQGYSYNLKMAPLLSSKTSGCLQITRHQNSEYPSLYVQITLHSSSHAPRTHRHIQEKKNDKF